MRSDRLPSRNSLAMDEASWNPRRDGDGKPGLKVVENLREVGRVRLVHREDDGLADSAGRIFCASFKKASHIRRLRVGRENLSLQVLNLEVFVLLVDDNRPAVFREGLGRDIGAQIENLGQTEKRAFGVFDRVNDVVTVGWKARFAAEIVIGVAKLASF